MQVVFVHGVATRGGPEYEDSKRNRDTLLREALFRQAVTIRSPLWGDEMPELAFGGKSFAKEGVHSLALFGGMAPPPPAQVDAEAAVLPQVAAKQPAVAIDLLFAERLTMADEAGLALGADDVKAFVAAVDLLDPGLSGNADQLKAADDDVDFVKRVRALSGQAAALSLTDTLADAAMSLADRVRNLVSTGAYDVVVDRLNPAVATFLGDVFRYLKQGHLRDSIRARVRADLAAAWSDRKADERLVLIGHSLGGVILYDMLSQPGAAGLPDGFKADALVTVGSQPGLFQELGLFDHTPTPEDGVGADGPAATGLWINTFDPIDPFGFRSEPMFTMANDYSFDSITGLLSAHTTYFKRPQFYAKLRRRLLDARVLA